MCMALTTKNVQCLHTPHYGVFQEAELTANSNRPPTGLYCLLHAREAKKRYNARGKFWTGHEIYRWCPTGDAWVRPGSWKKVSEE